MHPKMTLSFWATVSPLLLMLMDGQPNPHVFFCTISFQKLANEWALMSLDSGEHRRDKDLKHCPDQVSNYQED